MATTTKKSFFYLIEPNTPTETSDLNLDGGTPFDDGSDISLDGGGP